MTKKAGRNKTEYPIETYKKIINSFIKNNPHITKISYLKICNYAEELYNANSIDVLIKHHYWKNGLGKKVVDEFNALLNQEANNTPSETIVSTREVINRLSSDSENNKKKIITALEMNEKKLYRYADQITKYESKINNLESEITELKEIQRNMIQKNEYYENTLFQWLELSNKTDIPLVNLFTVGKTKSKHTEKFMKEIFTDNSFNLFNQLTLADRKSVV